MDRKPQKGEECESFGRPSDSSPFKHEVLGEPRLDS